MKKLLFQIISAGLGLYLATLFVAGVTIRVFTDSNFFGIALTSNWHLLILFGIVLGLLNFFVKPILNVITLPLRIITFGLFSFVINMALIFVVDIIFEELSVPLYLPLLYTSLIILALNAVFSIFTKSDK